MKYSLLALALWVTTSSTAMAFDHQHHIWTRLLHRHVVVLDEGRATRVRYSRFAEDQPQLDDYLDRLAAVTPTQYLGWTKTQQLAFLINAYNAFTVKKVLTRYPDLSSIRDFGRFFGNPWKDRFFTLLGERRSLDQIEHDLIRRHGAFNEPRIHFALNCASIGCPALRPEAYVSGALDAQLEQQTVHFLSDRSRNGYDPENGALEVSQIFDWYGEDFIQPTRGVYSVEQYLAGYAQQLADSPAARAAIRRAGLPLRFSEYDWSLNDQPVSPDGGVLENHQTIDSTVRVP